MPTVKCDYCDDMLRAECKQKLPPHNHNITLAQLLL